MLIYFDTMRKITSHDEISHEEALVRMQENPLCVWYEGGFSFFDGAEKEGCTKEFYIDENGAISIQYAPADPPLTEAEQAVLQTAINTEYLLYLMESTI